ncbi:MAG TPA: toll/interleukin-1 receptor domain-containing protein [Devosia sp.]|nr:toll/interleukin-1 receptor domain-containing protein [Devosia sp.]
MADIFISYSRVDAPLADKVVGGLRDAGYKVWIDATGIEEGRAYDRQIEQALRDCDLAVVLWSRISVDSEWVRNEAGDAYGHGKLIPLLTDDAEPPLQFRSVQAIDFRNWNGAVDARQFQQLKAALARRLAEAAGASVVEPALPEAPPVPLVRQVLERTWLAFADRETERRFSAYFDARYLAQIRMYTLIVTALYCVYAVAGVVLDKFGGTSAFQLIVTPVLVVAFLLSLWPPILRYWRPFVFAYGTLGALAIIFGVRKLFLPSNMSADSSSYLVGVSLLAILTFIGTAPLRFPETVVICLIPYAMVWLMPQVFGIQPTDPSTLIEIITGAYVMVVVAGWWRERQARTWFMETDRGRASSFSPHR